MIFKKGTGEALMFFAFIFLILIIGAGLVWGTSSFYGRDYEFRHIEAELLAEHTLKCFKQREFFTQGFDIYSECGLNKDVVENGKYLIYFESKEDGNKKFTLGVLDYKNQCSFLGSRSNDDFPKCVNGTTSLGDEEFYYVFGSDQNKQRSLT